MSVEFDICDKLHCYFVCIFLDLISVLLSASNENLSAEYGTKVLKFFNRLLQLGKEHFHFCNNNIVINQIKLICRLIKIWYQIILYYIYEPIRQEC